MKKIFLLTLFSVLFLSAFCQISGGTEIISKINISTFVDDMEEQNARIPFWKWLRHFFYRDVVTEQSPGGGVILKCNGLGFKTCTPDFSKLYIRGISPEIIEGKCIELIEACNDKIAEGEYSGSVSIKVAQNETRVYYIYSMIWELDPKKPYNGNAEITIFKTDNFGLR